MPSRLSQLKIPPSPLQPAPSNEEESKWHEILGTNSPECPAAAVPGAPKGRRNLGHCSKDLNSTQVLQKPTRSRRHNASKRNPRRVILPSISEKNHPPGAIKSPVQRRRNNMKNQQSHSHLYHLIGVYFVYESFFASAQL